jgi:hypothetical protein
MALKNYPIDSLRFILTLPCTTVVVVVIVIVVVVVAVDVFVYIADDFQFIPCVEIVHQVTFL